MTLPTLSLFKNYILHHCEAGYGRAKAIYSVIYYQGIASLLRKVPSSVRNDGINPNLL